MSRIKWTARAAVAIVATALACYGLALASDASLPLHDSGMALLRLSWSARPERIEVCREVTREEMERLGEHMRQRVRCDGRFATYALRVQVNGRMLDEAVVRGAGLRNDRPIYLLRDFRIPPGTGRIRIRFERREHIALSNSERSDERAEDRGDTGTFAGRGNREYAERERRSRAAIPPLLLLDTTLTVAAGHVLLVTIDQDRRVLRLKN